MTDSKTDPAPDTIDDGPRHRRGRKKPAAERDPSARDLRRLAERDRRAKGRRRVAWALVGAVALVSISVVASVWWLERPGPEAAVPDPVPLAGEGESVLVKVVDGSEVVGTALAAAHPNGPDTMILFPGALSAIVPGYGTWDLAFASEVDDPDLLALTLTNLLGARVDGTIEVPAAALAALLDGAELELPSPLLVEEGTDQVVAAAAGIAARPASTLERILTEQGTDDQLSWMVRQGAVWQALRTASESDDSIIFDLVDAATGDVVVGRSVLESLVADEAGTITAAQVESLDTFGTGAERYRLQVDDAATMVDERLSWLDIVVGERIRVEVLNGTGEVGITVPIAAALVKDGYRVVRTDNADTLDFGDTRVVGHTLENQQSALAVQALLGFGEVRIEQRQPSLVVDVTVIVGDDFS